MSLDPTGKMLEKALESMDNEPKDVDRAGLKARLEQNQTAALELSKDAQLLANQSRVLKSRSEKIRADAKELRKKIGEAQTLADGLTSAQRSDGLLTVMEACQLIGVCERTLRRVIKEPEFEARMVQRSHRAGIFYKWVLLLPPDLVEDLSQQFAAKKAGL